MVYRNLARLSPDGALDTTFRPNPGNAVTSVFLQESGELLFDAGFTLVGGVVVRGLARISESGVLDSTFSAPSGIIATDSIIHLAGGGYLHGGTVGYPYPYKTGWSWLGENGENLTNYSSVPEEGKRSFHAGSRPLRILKLTNGNFLESNAIRPIRWD